MTRKQASTLSLMILAIIALSFLVSRRLWFRLDLTKNKTYTISAVSRGLHNEIPDKVRITYFVSDKLKAIHPMPGEIEDLLKEYASYSRGKIQLLVRDPAKAKLAEIVEELGIIPQQIQTVEQDQASVATVYTGIVIEYLDQLEVLPVVFSLETLEYDLTSRIRSMVRGSSRLLGVLYSGDSRSFNENYQYLMSSFVQAGYQLRMLNPVEVIPETVSAVIALDGVESFNNNTLYLLDNFIQNGGKVLFTVKGVRINTESDLSAQPVYDGGLLQMLSSYGVTVLPEIVMDRTALTMQYQTRSPSGAVQVRITRYPQWIRVLGENGNPMHPVSAKFSGLDMYWASPLELREVRGVEAAPLFTTTDEAWSMREPFYTSPELPMMFGKDAADTSGAKILGVSLTGVFPSWYEGRQKPEKEDGSELPDMPAQAKPSRLVIAGDTDFATSFMTVTNAQRNIDFFIQSADWMSNDDDIIGIRSRESRSNRLDRINDPVKRAAAMRFAQIINVFLVPLLVIVAGILLAWRRRARGVGGGAPAGGAVKARSIKGSEKKEPQNDV
jgi:gliding-associated putative ABC transporter substrate-binding component GldG